MFDTPGVTLPQFLDGILQLHQSQTLALKIRPVSCTKPRAYCIHSPHNAIENSIKLLPIKRAGIRGPRSPEGDLYCPTKKPFNRP